MQELIATPWLLVLLGGMVLVAGATSRMVAASRPAAPSYVGAGSGHWLQEWLSTVGEYPRLDVEHVREFHESADTVFAALVQVLAAEGHIESIEGYGTVVVFSAHRCRMTPGRPLRARVHRTCGTTVLEVTSEAPQSSVVADHEGEVVRVHHLLNLLAHRLHGSTRLGRAAALAHAS